MANTAKNVPADLRKIRQLQRQNPPVQVTTVPPDDAVTVVAWEVKVIGGIRYKTPLYV
jgi:hypothetical protein